MIGDLQRVIICTHIDLYAMRYCDDIAAKTHRAVCVIALRLMVTHPSTNRAHGYINRWMHQFHPVGKLAYWCQALSEFSLIIANFTNMLVNLSILHPVRAGR